MNILYLSNSSLQNVLTFSVWSVLSDINFKIVAHFFLLRMYHYVYTFIWDTTTLLCTPDCSMQIAGIADTELQLQYEAEAIDLVLPLSWTSADLCIDLRCLHFMWHVLRRCVKSSVLLNACFLCIIYALITCICLCNDRLIVKFVFWFGIIYWTYSQVCKIDSFSQLLQCLDDPQWSLGQWLVCCWCPLWLNGQRTLKPESLRQRTLFSYTRQVRTFFGRI